MTDVASIDKITDALLLYIKEQSRSDHFSGSVLMARHGIPILKFSSGFANREKSILNTMETKFNLGSANKMFTGVAVAQLVEAGIVGFHDPIGTYIPDYPNTMVRERVTIHHLLTHTSGLGSFIDIDRRYEFLAARKRLHTIGDIVNLFKNKPLPYPTGEFHYSADGYEVMGAIIEAVSGQNYYDYIREHIYKISNMANTDSYEIDPTCVGIDFAIGYTHRDPRTDSVLGGERIENFGSTLLKGTAGGGGYSTCLDLLSFTRALYDHKLLSPKMTEEVTTPKITIGRKGNQTKYQGYGFQIFDIDGVVRIGHPGRFAGVNTRIDMYPSLGYTVIVLSNYDPPSAFDIAEKASELITQH